MINKFAIGNELIAKLKLKLIQKLHAFYNCKSIVFFQSTKILSEFRQHECQFTYQIYFT